MDNLNNEYWVSKGFFMAFAFLTILCWGCAYYTAQFEGFMPGVFIWFLISAVFIFGTIYNNGLSKSLWKKIKSEELKEMIKYDGKL